MRNLLCLFGIHKRPRLWLPYQPPSKGPCDRCGR